MNESRLSTRFHDALGDEDVPAELTSLTRAALRRASDAPRGRLQWFPAVVATVLAVAIIGSLLAVAVYRRDHNVPVTTPPRVENCTSFVSLGAGWSGSSSNEAFLFTNAAGATCNVRTPMIALIDATGTALDVPQDFAPGASQTVMQLKAHQSMAVHYSIISLPCQQSLRFQYVRATFGAGTTVQIDLAGELCPGSRITTWAPVQALSCPDGSYTWAQPDTGVKPTC